MYGLYWNRGSGAFTVEALLCEIGLPYERIAVDLRAGAQREADYLRLNPRGQVPALRLPDGSIMTETAAMALQLCETHPQAGLLPAPGTAARAQALRWLFFAAANLYEGDLRWYYPERYSTDPAAAPGIRAQAGADMDRDFAILEEAAAAGGPWFLEGGFSALDAYLAMLAGWHPEPERFPGRFPRLARLVRAVAARPAIVPLWREHYLEAAPPVPAWSAERPTA